MTNVLNSKIAKASLGLIVGAVAFSGALVASAQTTGCYQFTTLLKVGSNSQAVKQLQMVLNSNPATALAVAAGANGSAGHETTYFGPATAAAVVKWQMANGISPTAPQIGPMSRAKLNASCGIVTTTPGTGTGTGTGTTQTGPVTASLATDNPAVTTILSGQALADLAHYTFTGNGTITQMTLQRTGLSTSADISNVYLFNGTQRITDGASVNTSGQIVFSGLNIPVNGSLTLSVRADMQTSNVTSVSLGISLVSFVANGTTVTANLAGNVMFVSTAPNGGTTVSFTSSANNAGSASVSAGLTGYTVWSAPIQVNGRAAWLKGANFRVIGSASTDAVQNIKLYVDGTQVGTSASENANGYVFFDLNSNPVNLTTGTHTIDVRGDIVKGSSRSFQFSLQNAADLVIVDSQLGINVATGCTSSCTSFTTTAQAGTITVNAGSVTTVVDPSFQTVTNVTGGATNAVIGKFKLHAYGEDVKVNSISITPSVTNACTSGSTYGSAPCNVSALSSSTTEWATGNGLNNVTLFLNGTQVGTQLTWTSGALTAWNLGSSMVIPAGVDSTLEVHADLVTASTATYVANTNYTAGTVSVQLNVGTSNGQGMTSLSTSGVNIPAANTSTTGLTIQTGSLSVAKNAAYTNQTLNPNTTHALIGSFVIQNNNTSEAVRITNYQVSLGLSTAASTNYSNLVTDETSGSGATPINPATCTGSCVETGTPTGHDSVNNFSVNYTLAPGATKTVNVYADLSSASAGKLIVFLLPTATGVSSNVSATPTSATTGQTVTLGTGTFNLPTAVTSSSTQAQFVAGGTTTGATDATKAEFNFTASSASATINELKFEDTDGNSIMTAVRVGSTTAPMVSNVADLTGLNISVPNGGAGAFVDAYASYAPVGSTGVASNQTSTLKLCYVKFTMGGTVTQYGSSDSCSSIGTSSYPVSSGQQMTLVGSKPTVTVATPVGSVVNPNAQVEAIDVTIAADAAGPIKVVSFPVNVTIAGLSSTTNNFTTANFKVTDANNNTISTATGGCGSTTSCTNVTVTLNSTTGYLIPAGTSQTFKVFVNTGAYTIPTTSLPNTYLYTTVGGSGTMSWLDTAGNNATPITGTSLIYNYPSSFTSSVHN